MLAHNIKEILTLVPEAQELVKKADLEQDFPVDSADSAAASLLRVNYLTKVAGKPQDPEKVAYIEKAASLFGVKEKVDELVIKFNSMEKKASFSREEVQMEEALFEGDLGGFGFLSLDKAAEKAENMCAQYGDLVKSAEVKRYAGQAWLNKEAALKTLANRYYASKEQGYVKIARVVNDSIRENDFSAIRDLCKTVTSLDKKAGLDVVGFNFYKEALLTKESALASCMSVNLAGEQVPYEKIQRFGTDRIAATVGKDIAASMTGNPVEDKAVLESLPRDLQVMIKSLVKSV